MQEKYQDMENHWQKIGLHGELLAIDVPQWSAVIDKKTQLMWAINTSKTANFPNPKNEITWDDAQVWVTQVNKSGWCGFADWRLPTIDEQKTCLQKLSSVVCILINVFLMLFLESITGYGRPRLFLAIVISFGLSRSAMVTATSAIRAITFMCV